GSTVAGSWCLLESPLDSQVPCRSTPLAEQQATRRPATHDGRWFLKVPLGAQPPPVGTAAVWLGLVAPGSCRRHRRRQKPRRRADVPGQADRHLHHPGSPVVSGPPPAREDFLRYLT